MTFYRLAAYHGIAQFSLTVAAVLMILLRWPTLYEWLVVSVFGLVAFVKGVDGYRRDPA